MRTTATDRCQDLIANAPAAGPCQYIRTIVSAADSRYVYVEVAASGHDGTLFRRASGSYVPALDNGNQPPPCSKVSAAGIPLDVWADVVHEIEGNPAGVTCYS
jgi:hypothetical protein